MGKYDIAYQSLSAGTHTFNFEIEPSLFDEFKETEVQNGKGKAVVELERHPAFMVLNVSIEGEIEVVCDRCLELFWQEVTFTGRLFVKFSSEVLEPEYDIAEGVNSQEEVLWINPSDNYLNLASYIYESMILSLPVQRVHPEDEDGISQCNEDMLGRFIVASDDDDFGVDFGDDDDDIDFGDEELESILSKINKK